MISCGKTTQRSPRAGLTLLEVVLSLAIFMISLVALRYLIASGARASVQARLETQAIVRCESTMNEVLAGIVPMQNGNAAFEDDEKWGWDLQVQTGPHPDMLELILTVSHEGTSSMAQASYSMIRYVRDPELFLDAQVEATAEGEQ